MSETRPADDARGIIDSQMTEKAFSQMVSDLAHLHGWLVYRTWNSIHSPKGYPDLTLCKPPEIPKQMYAVPFGNGHGRIMRDATAPRLIVAELKVGKNQPTAAQCQWLESFRLAGIPAYVWYPSQWDEIERIVRGEE